MKNRVFLIHGWEGRPDGHWFPWLALELRARGWEVNAPQMPHSAEPKVGEWLKFLREYVGKPNQHTYLVGHSLGCITIARYLAGLPSSSPFPKGSTRKGEGFKSSASADLGTSFMKGGVRVGGCVFVAGFSGRVEVPEISEFYSLPFNAEKAKTHCEKFVVLFSDNDQCVPMEKSLEFAKQLGAKTILHRGKGHFCSSEGVTALPSVLTALLKMSE